jgi:uncharacterized protein (TIGR00255 family)
MIKSMTGFSSRRLESDKFIATAEVKSLNSKFLDLSIRIPRIFSDKEPDLRNLASRKLERGKVSIGLELQMKDSSETSVSFNAELFKSYFTELKKLAESVGADEQDLFKAALQSPDVIRTEEDGEASDQYWEEIAGLLEEAMDGCNEFRITEGESLNAQLLESLGMIVDCKAKIVELDPSRIVKVRERIKGQLEESFSSENIDENRFEQELIYFIEKLDISEELVRLDSHLKYFSEVLDSERSKGKKLGFISQEIGREINTIGSKANDAAIQKLVVQMKDELEKIKEQVLNVL